ncbi:hypothetical protein [Ahniella affigens]|uniref:hypothetical protein n=1 Tax=Ahniella affigens TaxID=2021234 RepID=UPI003CCD0CD2
MAHGMHPGMTMSMHTGTHESHLTAMTSEHGKMAHQHRSESTRQEQAPSKPIKPSPGGCCDGQSCQCGCVLPPALAFSLGAVIPPEFDVVRPIPVVTHCVAYRGHPPFRPPSP